MASSRGHVVVVGAGLGGLSCAVALAAKGVRVTVLERAAQPGGKMREVAVDGRAVDSGPTVLTMRHVFDALFEAAGERLDDHVTLQRASVIARHAWDGGATLDLYTDIDRSADAIGRLAGAAEARGYLAFCEYARRIHETVEGPFMSAQRPSLGSVLRDQGVRGLASLASIDATRTMWRALGDYFRDPRLRQLFGRYATYCGSSPWLAPATLNVVAHVEREGVWTVSGGMYRLAEAVAGLAARQGAALRYGAHVAEVTVSGGRATGVRLEDGERIEADAVVVNADTAALSDGRFGPAAAKAWRREASEGRSLSAVTYSLATRAAGFPLVRHNVFFSRDYEREFKDLAGDELPHEPTVYACAQDRDDSGAAPADGVDRILLIVNAPARGGRRPFTTAEIDACTRRTAARLESLGLSLDWSPSRFVTTTPDAFERMFPSTGGALYGPPSHGWKSPLYRAPARSKVPGIFLAGGSAHPGAGVPMVTRSGLLAAESVLTSLASTARSAREATRGGTSDALSDDGRHAITLIAMLGSVFSPFYAKARGLSRAADPLDHCALNVALYTPRGKVWSLDERGRDRVHRTASALTLGASVVAWERDALVIHLHERTTPFLTARPLGDSRIVGRVTVHPRVRVDEPFALDAAGAHLWWSAAPLARVEVELDEPAIRWSADRYHDANAGDGPLEDTFTSWDWSRATVGDDAVILYDAAGRDGTRRPHARRVTPRGRVEAVEVPRAMELPRTRWGVRRATRTDGGAARVRETLEDSPFYARSVLGTRLLGRDVAAMHETLDLERFRKGWVQFLLPFKTRKT